MSNATWNLAMLEQKSTDDLIRIAVAGGGFSLDGAARSIDDLIRIAVAASGRGARITYTGMGHRSTDELIRISVAGKGCVEFTD